MKYPAAFLGAMLLCRSLLAGSLPAFTAHPTNQLRALGTSATFTVAATGADSFQWRWSGVDIPGATNGTLTVTNLHSTNSGYYLAIAKNATGCVPSQMAYLNVTAGGGILPFSNYDISSNAWTLVRYAWGSGMPPNQCPTNGIARIVVGPELDQMNVVGSGDGSGPFGPFDYFNFAWGYDPGYFDTGNQTLTNVSPGQSVYYRVQIAYPNASYIQRSTTLRLTAGGGTNAVPLSENLRFPGWIEWPDPNEVSTYYTTTNPLCVAGATTNIQLYFLAYQDFGPPNVQWRKDGKEIPGATNLVNSNPFQLSFYPSLTLSNLQPADAGVYDLMVFGNNWIVSPRIFLSIQFQPSPVGPSFFQSPRKSGNQFLADFIGEPGRSYIIECSSNLANWTGVATITNTSGTYFFLHNTPPDGNLFYRSRLLP